MRILQISDTHNGITKLKTIKEVFKQAANESPDLLMHCGDYSGGQTGHKHVRLTANLMRDYFPNTPIVTVLGNHDYWAGPSPAPVDFAYNYGRIKEIFESHKIHFMDEAGIYKSDDIAIIGCSGWYSSLNPPTNDRLYLPSHVEANTNRWMERKARSIFLKQLDQLDDIYGEYITTAFISHFPVIDAGNERKGAFEEFCWDASIGALMQSDYACKYFFCGHAHQLHTGPLRYESGSDYYNPKYQLVEI